MDISKDNRGTSLIELVIALMISSIIILMIIFFLNTAFKGFWRTNDDVNLQMEAQTIINQLSTLIMESEYMENEDAEATASLMMEYIDSEGRTRYIFKHINKLDDGSQEIEYNAVLLSEGCLYLLITYDWLEAKEGPIIKEEHLLAEYVKEFYIEPDSDPYIETDFKSVIIDLKLSLGSDSESISKRVKFRNAR